MLFGTVKRLQQTKGRLNVKYRNESISFVKEYVYLGNTIDSNMNLNRNFEKSYRKASGRLRLLNAVRRNLTTNAAYSIYKMMILPILTYSSTLKTELTSTNTLKLSRLENRASRIVGTLADNISQQIEKEVISMVTKCITKKLQHSTFDEYFDLHKHGHGTRNNNKMIRLPKVKLSIAKQTFYYGGAKIFNNLSLSTRAKMLESLT